MVDEQKHPGFIDEIEQEADEDLHPLLKKILDNVKPIGLGIAGVILAVGVYSGYQSFQESKVEDARTRLGSILAQQDTDARIDALQDFLKQAPESLRTGISLELAKSGMAADRLDVALNAWKRLAAESDPTLRTVAGLGQARVLSMQGKDGEALDLLVSLKSNAPEGYGAILSTQIAKCAERVGDTTRALAAYQDMKNQAKGQDTAYIDYKIAKLSDKTAD
jgi:predicted negative regulator of RcsB-dependent stress response